MWEAVKVICGLILFVGIIIAGAMTVFIFSWVFKIIGFLILVVVVTVFIGWAVWELASGWWQDRREQKKKASK